MQTGIRAGALVQDIVVINPKGGCGKSTIAMNLAGFFACWGIPVGLVDLDPQATCLDWLDTRPLDLPEIKGSDRLEQESGQQSIDYRIIDVPSSCFDSNMQTIVAQAYAVIIPLLPSINDFRATEKFIEEMASAYGGLDHMRSLTIIANRVKNHTKSFGYLKDFVRRTKIPCHGILRDTQNYIRAAESGLSIFELPGHMNRNDIKQWQRVIRWLCVDKSVTVTIPQILGTQTADCLQY